MGERLVEQRRILEFISDAFCEIFRGATPPLCRLGLGGVRASDRFRYGARGWLLCWCLRGGFGSRFSAHLQSGEVGGEAGSGQRPSSQPTPLEVENRRYRTILNSRFQRTV